MGFRGNSLFFGSHIVRVRVANLLPAMNSPKYVFKARCFAFAVPVMKTDSEVLNLVFGIRCFGQYLYCFFLSRTRCCGQTVFTILLSKFFILADPSKSFLGKTFVRCQWLVHLDKQHIFHYIVANRLISDVIVCWKHHWSLPKDKRMKIK